MIELMTHGHDHDHDHACDEHHSAARSHRHESDDDHGLTSGKMGVAVVLTLAFVVVETIAGYFAHSLALLSDAGHNFADAAALGLS